jgi:ribosomal protein S6--L-glutamate ligase
MRILVLSAAPNMVATKSIVKAAKKKGHEVDVKHPGHLLMLISDSINGYDRIYDGFEHENKPGRVLAKDYDAIIPRLGSDLNYNCAIVRHLNENLNIFSTQTADGIRITADKLLSQQKLSAAGVRTPKTVIGNKSIFPDWMIKQVGGLPSISKELTGSQGKTVYPLESSYQTNVFLKNFNKKRKNLLIQGFIDGSSKDIRAIVIGGKVIVAMERTAVKGELRANISQGGSGKKIELSEEDQDMCIKAAQACGQEVAGVDLMKNKSGVSYVIEVNSTYGYRVEEITGVDISTPLIEYCEQNYKDGNYTNAKTLAVNLFDRRVQMIYGSLDLYLQKLQLETILGDETKESMAFRLAYLKKAVAKLRL